MKSVTGRAMVGLSFSSPRGVWGRRRAGSTMCAAPVKRSSYWEEVSHTAPMLTGNSSSSEVCQTFSPER